MTNRINVTHVCVDHFRAIIFIISLAIFTIVAACDLSADSDTVSYFYARLDFRAHADCCPDDLVSVTRWEKGLAGDSAIEFSAVARYGVLEEPGEEDSPHDQRNLILSPS
jgi:hypothetical protein